MKIAACFANDREVCRSVSEKMAQAQQFFDDQSIETFAFREGCVSRVTGTERFSQIPLVRKTDTGNLLLMTGVPLDLHGSLDVRLDRVLQADYHHAARILKNLEGAFAALFWDASNRKLVIVTDAMGLQPLYIFRHEDLLLLATEIKAFPASGKVEIQMDPAGWGAFISLGHHIGRDTQLAGVKRVDPATVMIYDSVSGNVTSERYWSWPEIQPDLTLERVNTEAMKEAMIQEIRAYTQHSRKGLLLLSGGFDSRITLAMLCQAGLPPDVLILAHQDELWGLDSKLAVRAAKQIQVRYQLVKPSRSYYSTNAYLDYLIMNELATPSLYLFIAQVSSYLNSGMQVVWDGTPPGYAFVPAFLPPGGFEVFLKESCLTRQDFGWQIASLLFGTARTDEMVVAFSESLKKEISKYPDNESGIAQFEAFHRMRNRTSPNALKVYANFALPFMLGVSRSFWESAAVVPYSASKNYELYFELFRRYSPPLARIPFLTGGKLFCDPSSGMLGLLHTAGYEMAKSRVIQKSRKACRRFLRGSKKYWTESQFLRLTWDRLNWDHPDIDPNGIRKLDYHRHLPFYWQMWQWIMSGQLNTRNSHTFFASTRD